jgi:hypothetical protein
MMGTIYESPGQRCVVFKGQEGLSWNARSKVALLFGLRFRAFHPNPRIACFGQNPRRYAANKF